MIRADVPQDVTEYKEQFFLGFTARQFVSIILMILIAVITFLFGRNVFTKDILVYFIVLEIAPLAAIGFLKYNGMGIEKIAVKVADFYFSNQRRRMEYYPPEIEIHDKVREIMLAELEADRKAELKERKREEKAAAKAAKNTKKKRSDENARNNSHIH